MKRLFRAARSLMDLGCYFHVFRIIHYYGYSHVQPKRQMTIGVGTTMAPNVSLMYGKRIQIGKNCRIGERCYIWAGPTTGRIVIGDDVSLAPEVFLTASNYQFTAGRRFREQMQRDQDIIIGNDVWLGARVTVTAGVTIGNGCIVGAGAVVTHDIPQNSIAGGVPARVISTRPSPESQA